jgi:hypothetical protein
MPYTILKVQGGYKVYGLDGKAHSKEPMSYEKAHKQLIALNISYARERGHFIPKLIPGHY